MILKDVVCLMPTNLYGVNDNFDTKSSHVIPGLITKFLNAKNNNTSEGMGYRKSNKRIFICKDLAEAIFKTKSSKKKLIEASSNNTPIFNVGSENR